MSTMVDSKFGKSVSKSVGRAKEKILQNLGKVDRTADEIFDEHVNNFTKQQCTATRLQKELNNYIRCIRACSQANRSLLEAVQEVYEPEWGSKELLSLNSQNVEVLWNDFAQRLAEQVLIPLNSYQGQFPEMRKKIEKRGRKLVDFDGERHALQALQSNPRRAESKLVRQRENLEAAKHTYEVLNSELHEELPGLFNSRIVFLVSAMSTLFASEHIFHSETSKVFTELEGLVERLAKESAKGNLNYKISSNAINSSDTPKEDMKANSPTAKIMTKSAAACGGQEINNCNNTTTSTSPTYHEENNSNKKEMLMMTNNKIVTNGGGISGGGGKMIESSEEDCNSIESSSCNKIMNDKGTSGGGAPAMHGILHRENGNSSEHSSEHHKNGHHVHMDDHEEMSNNKTEKDGQKKTEGFLYKVRATYRYNKEDVDELSFEAGEIINVIEFDDPEDSEEGWLQGVKENGERGLFPANFTRPI